MIPSVWTTNRRLVPRWRSLAITVAARELSSPPKIGENPALGIIPDNLLEKLTTWRIVHDVISAGELVETALVEAKEAEAANAARFLLSPQSTATLPLKRLAGLALKRAGFNHEVPAALAILPEVAKKVWRDRTRLYPHNPLGWVELALFDVAAGRRAEALRSMLIAIQLAPNDRHVLRCASRLFLHLHDPDRAYDLIAKNSATPLDPWLIAAELSIAELAERKPRFFEQGRRMVEQAQFYPRQITELSGALATLELEAGRRKKARDLFRHSTVDPTGNALAQAEWASPAFGVEIVPPQSLANATEADEATVFHLLRAKKFEEVSDACQRWSDTEPYSIRPFEIGSSTAAMIGDYQRALEFADKGLLVRPDGAVLLNTRGFVLANLGRLKEAEQCLRNIGQSDERVWLIRKANMGLIEMRRGNHQLGIDSYQEAIDGFTKEQNPQLAEVAKLFLAREASLARLPEAKALVAASREGLRKLNLTAHEHVLNEAERALEDTAGQLADAS